MEINFTHENSTILVRNCFSLSVIVVPLQHFSRTSLNNITQTLTYSKTTKFLFIQMH